MIKLSFVGDISLGEHYFSFGHGPRTLIENGEDIFDSVSDVLRDSDFVIGNLEGPISDIGYDSQDPHKRVFRGSPKSVRQLKNANINILNIANNHSIQHGNASLEESISLLEQEDILVIGKAASPIEHIVRDNQTIALIGCSLIPDNTDANQTIYFSPTEDQLLQTIRTAKSNSDHVVLFIHWGTEGELLPSVQQRELAEKITLAGANIVVGHHTHSLQPIILNYNRVIAFSLGNFVFDLPWSRKNRESVVLHIETEQHGITNTYINFLSISKNGKPINVQSRIELKNVENDLTAINDEGRIPEPIKKLLFFVFNIGRGDSKTKMRFLLWKIRKKLK